MAVGITVLIGMPLAVLIGTSPRANKVDHRRPRLHADDADLRLPRAGRALLRHRGRRCRSSRPSSTPSRRWCGSRASGSARCRPPRSRPPTRPARPTWQRLAKVQLPMARKTIIVGLNQTTLAALSMATIAAYINGPGLGKPVLNALVANDFGGSFVPGVLIVVMAVMLDRTTTAASERSEKVARGGGGNLRAAPHHAGRHGGRRPRRGLPVAARPEPGRVPRVHDRRQGRRLRPTTSWPAFVDVFGGVGQRVQGRHHPLVPQPDAVPARRVAVVALRTGHHRAGLRVRRCPRAGDDGASALPESGTSTCGTTR